MDFDFNPATTVIEGTDVTITQEVTTTTEGSGTQDCGLTVGSYVDDGNALIQAVSLAGAPRPCADQGKKFCTTGTSIQPGNACSSNVDCGVGGVCTAVTETDLIHQNPFDGSQSVLVDTSGLGGTVLGFTAQYSGGGEFENAAKICTDLTVNVAEEECSGALISVVLASGNGTPAAPGGPYDWEFVVNVHACEDLIGVSAQGGTNGWAQLTNRSEDSLVPSKGTAVIRNANKKTDVVLWTIGDMAAGTNETLIVMLNGSIKKTPDCQERFLSGAWSALFSTDGTLFEKSDYTGRVSVFTDSNGNPYDCY